MRKVALSTLLLLLAATPALADLYQWKDTSGVIHITDSMEKVPPEYKDDVKVFKEGAKESAPQDETQAPEETIFDDGAPALDAAEEYGGETLDWWVESFKEKRSEISGLQTAIETKMDFMKVFEGGRRFGQTYDAESVERYKAYQNELPQDKKRLSALLEDLKDFEGRARRAGVPEEIRE